MKLYNLKQHQQQVSFGQAVRQGLGRQQGLFFPAQLPQLGDIDALLAMDFVGIDWRRAKLRNCDSNG